MCMSLIISVDGCPKVYVYWKGTSYMVEVDPSKQSSQKYNRHDKVEESIDLTSETYAEIFDKSVVVHNKKNGKRIAQLMNEGENFTQVYSNGSKDKVYTLSNFGLKRWKL